MFNGDDVELRKEKNTKSCIYIIKHKNRSNKMSHLNNVKYTALKIFKKKSFE